MTRLLTVLMAVFLYAGGVQAQSFADPQPSMDTPRQIIVSVDSGDEGKLNSVLYNIMNIQKHYGQDNVELRVVAYGPAVRALLLKDSIHKSRVSSILMYGVEFVACGNTLTTIHKGQEDLIDGVEIVPAGLPEIIERRLMGWQDIKP